MRSPEKILLCLIHTLVDRQVSSSTFAWALSMAMDYLDHVCNRSKWQGANSLNSFPLMARVLQWI